MGDYVITLRGTGPHHSEDNIADADHIGRELATHLKESGHIVHSARFWTQQGPKSNGRFGESLLPVESEGDGPPVDETAKTEPPPPDLRSFGQRAFDAYREARGGKNHDGTPTPTWEMLNNDIRDGWHAAAAALLG